MREAYLAAQARKLGLDPRAVLAIAAHEGLSGGVGDGGHAFGPGQLNDAGGVLTNAPANEHNNKWAWSNAGINFWLKGVAQVAGGLTGKAAIDNITKRYERPANPAAEIADAWSRYKGGGAAAPGPAFTGGPNAASAGSSQSVHFDAAQFRAQSGMLLMQDAAARAAGQAPTQDLSAGLEAIRKAATTKVDNSLGAGGIPVAGGGGGLGGRVTAIAGKQVGTPYVWGGESKSGFDCSGLVQYCYGKLGIQLPRTAAEQGKTGRAVAYKNLKPGDLLVENSGDHVVMYAGNGKVVAAPHTGTNVQYQPLNYFPSSQYYARRIVG